MQFDFKVPEYWKGRWQNAFGFAYKNVLNRLPSEFSPYQFSKLSEIPEELGQIILEYGEKNNKIKLEFNGFPFLKEPKVPIPVKIPFIKDNSNRTMEILAPTPHISFKRKKKLVTTPLNENYGEVIENWGNDNYEIRMQGLIIDMKEHIYPNYRIKILHKLFEYNGLVSVTGLFFDEKDIKFIYFKNIEINPVEGFDDTVKFTLTAKASKEINLKID